MDEQSFVRLLEDVLTPDTERVKAATTKLRKEEFKLPVSLARLIHVLISHESAPLRQLAAVEARTLIPRHWKALAEEQKSHIRASLLRSIMEEKAVLVRHSSARLVAAIAGIDLGDGKWPHLPAFLQQAATSKDVSHREIGLYMLYTIIDAASEAFTDKWPQLLTLFNQTVRDRESIDVRVNTMLALSRVGLLLDAEDEAALAAFQVTLDPMMAVLRQVVEQQDEDRTTQAFEVFQVLLGCDFVVISKHFRILVQLMSELAASKALSNDARSQALSYLMQCVKYRRLKVKALSLGTQLTTNALLIATEVGELHAEEDDDDSSPGRSALGLLDAMAQSLPPSQVIMPLLSALPQFANSPDPNFRRAGILALGFCVEGAPDFISIQLKNIYPLVLQLLLDPDIRVRQAALYGLARLADELADDLSKLHETLIPVLVRVLDEATVQVNNGVDAERQLDVIKGTCNALDAVFGGMEDVGGIYVAELIPRLQRLLDQPDYKVKTAAVSATGTVAAASKEAFKPYFETVVHAFSPYVAVKDGADELDLRGIACEALGSIATAVGPIAFGPYVQPLMQATEEALHLDHARLRETTYILWSTLSKVYGEEFAPFLDGVAKALLDCLEQHEGGFEVEVGEEGEGMPGSEITIGTSRIKVASHDGEAKITLTRTGREVSVGDDEVVDIDDLIPDDDESWDEFTGASAAALEKEIALDVIGDVVSHTGKRYLPHFEKTMQLVLGLMEHPYDGVRKAAVGALWRGYTTLWEILEDGPGRKWEPGLPLKTQSRAELVKLGELGMTATLGIWEDEMDRDTVSDINRNLSAVLRSSGPATLAGAGVIDTMTSILISILAKQHPCQQDLGELEEDRGESEESAEYDWLVIDNALDVISGMASALGAGFGEVWKLLTEPVLRIAYSSEAEERSAAVGAIAGCMEAMGEATTPHTASLLKLLLLRLSDSDPATNSNAAFATGILCQNSQSTEQLQRAYPALLAKLEPLLQQAEASSSRDNAAGCVSRMILRLPSHVPLQAVLPALAADLPLRQDYDENEPVWRMLVRVYQEVDLQADWIADLTTSLVPVLAQVLAPPEEQLTAETRSEVLQLVRYLAERLPHLLQGNEALAGVMRGVS
ncbi:MAG: hypothetical protein M1826_006225 [Phylliscum demangeonii]|nr:MAG: hypothetical protein M1826_006225 [Phylliscum demangeonii]